MTITSPSTKQANALTNTSRPPAWWIEAVHCEKRNFRPFWFLWPWPRSDDRHIWTYPVSAPLEIYRMCENERRTSRLSKVIVLRAAFSYAWSLPVTWQRCMAVTPFYPPTQWKNYATRKLDGSTGVVSDRSLHCRNRDFGRFRLLWPWPWPDDLTNWRTLPVLLGVINSNNWHSITYRFGVIAAYCSNFGHFAFLSDPLGGGGLSTTYDVHLGLIEKRVMDFVLVLIEVFSLPCYGWVATSEEIANRRFGSNAVTLIQNFR